MNSVLSRFLSLSHEQQFSSCLSISFHFISTTEKGKVENKYKQRASYLCPLGNDDDAASMRRRRGVHAHRNHNKELLERGVSPLVITRPLSMSGVEEWER